MTLIRVVRTVIEYLEKRDIARRGRWIGAWRKSWHG